MPKYESYETKPTENQYGKYSLWIKYRSAIKDKPWFKEELQKQIARMHDSKWAEITLLKPGKPYDLTIHRHKITEHPTQPLARVQRTS